MRVAGVIRHAQRTKQPEPLIRYRRHPRDVGAATQPHYRRSLGGADHRGPKILDISRGLARVSFCFRQSGVGESPSHLGHARCGKSIHRKPMPPVAVIFQVARRQQPIFENFLVAVSDLSKFPLVDHPVRRTLHALDVLLQPLLVARVQIVLRQSPQHGSVVQIVLSSGVVVLVINLRPVIHGALVARERSLEGFGALKSHERPEVLGGELMIPKRVQHHALEGCFM